MTDSMSSPTYPAWVRVVQSHIAKGTSRHRAKVWASKVLPETGQVMHRNQHAGMLFKWWLFPRLQGFGENVRPFIPRLHFFSSFFLRWRLVHAYQFHSLCQDKSTVAQRAEMTVAECSLTSCMLAHFWIGSHTMPGQQHSKPTPTSLGQGCVHV